MKQLLCCALLLSGLSSAGQTVPAQKDSVKVQELSGVIVISRQASRNKNSNLLSTLDQYLSSHEQVDLIKRGAYAWELMLNGLSSERSVITIDGMRIYGACTDKMDPVSSYVETTNLSRADVKNGQSGNAHGTSIGGSLDLVRKKSDLETIVFQPISSVDLSLITGNAYWARIFSTAEAAGILILISPFEKRQIIAMEKSRKSATASFPNSICLPLQDTKLITTHRWKLLLFMMTHVMSDTLHFQWMFRAQRLSSPLLLTQSTTCQTPGRNGKRNCIIIK